MKMTKAWLLAERSMHSEFLHKINRMYYLLRDEKMRLELAISNIDDLIFKLDQGQMNLNVEPNTKEKDSVL